MITNYKTEKRTNPLLLAERWAQDPNRPQPGKVERMKYNLFFLPGRPINRPHPWSVEASMKES